jgi:YesN/AraC family two-component response regulator
VKVATVRVLVVGDEDDIRALLGRFLEIANDGLWVAAKAAGGDEALRCWREQRPEVVLLD